MYRQILVNVCKKHVIYIVYYITEFCQKLTKGLKKKNKNILCTISFMYISNPHRTQLQSNCKFRS